MSAQTKDVFAGPRGPSTAGRPLIVVRTPGAWCSACHRMAPYGETLDGCAMQTDRGKPFDPKLPNVWICFSCIDRLSSSLIEG
jgi:hypothetical protein